MTRHRRYYLGRVHKLGSLDQSRLLLALREPRTIEKSGYSWTITDVQFGGNVEAPRYVFGYLSKFHPKGVVRAVDPHRGVREEHPEPNLLIEASPFVYLPEYSGIAYQHIWNKIERRVFARRFGEIVEATFDNFFVGCSIQPISDLRTFVRRLDSLSAITELSARVHPPNPLFGRAWRSLRDYLRRRDTAELAISERGTEEKPVKTSVHEHIVGLARETSDTRYDVGEPIDLGDAALLMAMDGYGTGRVRGVERGAIVTIRTGETQKCFEFGRSPAPGELYEKALDVFESVNQERELDHQ